MVVALPQGYRQQVFKDSMATLGDYIDEGVRLENGKEKKLQGKGRVVGVAKVSYYYERQETGGCINSRELYTPFWMI